MIVVNSRLQRDAPLTERAIVLAAGNNRRLQAVTSGPKTLLRIRNETLLDRILVACQTIGVRHVSIVIGYKGDMIAEHVAVNSWRYRQLSVKTIQNDRFNELNNIYSYWLARREMDAPYLLINSDVLFDQRIFTETLKSSIQSCLVVDTSKKLGKEEMKVVTNKSGLITDISKQIEVHKAMGEYTGLAKFVSSEVRKSLIVRVKEILDSGRGDSFYEEAIRLVSMDRPSIMAARTNGVEWTEIDTPKDYSDALKLRIAAEGLSTKEGIS